MEEPTADANFDAGSNGDDAELYLLKWNSHQNHFANKFSELLDEDDISFADVTLACEGNFLQAHRLVLSVCSPFFKNLFKVNSAEKGPATIVLANVRYTDLENILHFIYRGQVNVRKEDLNKFLETGEQLQIDGLMGQHGQKQGTSKRRYSEGGNVLPRANQTQQAQNSSYLGGNRGRNSMPQTQTYKVMAGNNRLASTVNSNQSGHLENSAKKPRISPTTSGMKQESALANNSTPARRMSTSSNVHLNANNANSSQMKKDEELEANDNGIKIMSVASINASVSAAVDYDADGNDVFEILDYEEDDRPEHEVDIPEDLIGAYGDGEDDVYYSYHQASSPYGRSSGSGSTQSLSQQSRMGGAIQARYPSIIDGVHFELISADEKKVAAQCKLCPGDKVIRGSGLTSSNFISHLRAFHKRELEEWREKRKTETRRRMDVKFDLNQMV